MLLFGHIGITLGASALVANLLPGPQSSTATRNELAEPPSRSPEVNLTQDNPIIDRRSWFATLANRIDIRLLLIGSMLPDIIDKPVGLYFFREEISNGRIYAHTLLFLVITAIAGYYLYRSRGKTHLLAIFFGVLAHFILDQLWNNTRTLFWPIMGLEFDRSDISNWLPDMLLALRTEPAIYVPELIGLLILGWFVISLWRRRKISDFLRYGRAQ